MKKILLISYMFPPIAGIGAQRPLSFVKYLPEYGISPVVFSPDNAIWRAYDPKSVDLPFLKRTKVYRCGIRRLRHYYELRYKKGVRNHPYFYTLGLRYIWFMDFFSSWYFECRRRVLRIAEEEGVDWVLTTSPPHSVHFFGLFLKRKLGIPWMMDLRDAMFDEPAKEVWKVIPMVQNLVELFYERIFYFYADAIVSVSQPILQSIGARHGTLGREAKFHLITNGFDEEDFHRAEPKFRDTDRLVMTYPGTFKGKHTPLFFLKALQRLIETHDIDPQDILVRFIGSFDERYLEMFRNFSQKVPIRVREFLPHEESISYQLSSDLLLLILTPGEREKGSQIFTGKFFEYLGAKRPIFAMVPEGPLKETIERGRFGFVLPPRDVSGIATKFKEIYKAWKRAGSIPYDPDKTLRNRFTRRRLTEELASILHGLQGRGNWMP